MPSVRPIGDADALAALLTRVADGDKRAFETLYRRTSGKIFAVCLHLVPRRDLAEEVTQEIYVRVWRSARRYCADRGAPMTWLITIARNAAVDRLRQMRREVPVADGENLPEHAETAGNALSAVVLREDGRALAECLGGLETEARRAILLSYCAGYSHGELAEELDVPLGTVKSWIRRGLLNLKTCLDA